MTKKSEKGASGPAKTDGAGAAESGKAGRRPEKTDNVEKVEELGGPAGPEPTRYGDWEVGGRCTDF